MNKFKEGYKEVTTAQRHCSLPKVYRTEYTIVNGKDIKLRRKHWENVREGKRALGKSVVLEFCTK